MSNKNLFENKSGVEVVVNEAGGVAYNLDPVAALVQYAVTGCLNKTYYASAETQLNTILELCEKVSPEQVAKIAVYARENGYMKDVPALLCVWLAAKRHNDLLGKIFNRVINNGKMLRNFMQILRSGVTGRKSLGTVPKRLVANWFNFRTPKEIFLQSVGNNPSFKDILRMAHPRPLDRHKNAMYRWFLGKEYVEEDLPDIIKNFEDYKVGKVREVPSVPFEMLTSLKLGQSEWCQIALKAGWHWLRMNLNTMQRHKVFEVPDMVNQVACRLSDRESIKKARVFPYQLMAAYLNAEHMPLQITEALQDALEIATENVPTLPGDGYVFVDVSASMSSPITGVREGSASKVRCVDVAGLMASAILRKNPSSHIVPFEKKVREHNINPRDTILTNAQKLSGMLGGGTNCSAPMQMLNCQGAKGSWIILISDNQSWVDTIGSESHNVSAHFNAGPGHTEFMRQWDLFKDRNPQAKMVAFDIQPYKTTQAQDRQDILNIGGMSDSVFTMMSLFLSGELDSAHWVSEINRTEL